ncbi:DMT family transporter [Streptomyces sp. NPDC054796]
MTYSKQSRISTPPGPLPTAPVVPEKAPARKPQFLTAVAFAFGGIGFWSTNALAGSTALKELDLGVVLTLQFASATLALAVIVAAQESRRRARPVRPGPPLTRSDYLRSGLVGLIGFCGTQTTQYVGFAYAPIVESNIIAYAWPMFAAIWLAVTAWSRRTFVGFLFSLLGFLGVAIMTVAQNSGSGGGSPLGYVAALVSALCMAYYTLASGAARAPATYGMLMGGVVGTLLALVIAFSTTTDWDPSLAWLAMCYVGIGPCAAGFLLWSAGMARSDGRLAPLGYATPVLSTCVLLLSGRTFGDASAAVGAFLVLLCTVGVLVNDRLSGEQRL